MDTFLRELKWQTLLCYLFNIAAFSIDIDKLELRRFEQVLKCLADAGLQTKAKLKSVTLVPAHSVFLGHLVSKDDFPDSAKLRCISQTGKHEIAGQVGLCFDYFRINKAS